MVRWVIIPSALAIIALSTVAVNAQGMPHPSLTPEKQTDKKRKPSDRKPNPLVVTIVESTEQTDARERAEAKGDQHDQRDLDAQIRAADAAEDQIPIGWLAAIFSGLNTLLIVWSLCLTRRANALTKDTQKPRPVISLAEFKREESISFNVCMTNVGGSGLVVTSTSYAWDGAPMGLEIRSICAVPSGETVSVRNVEHLHIFKSPSKLVTIKITIDGPFLCESEKIITKRFNVFREFTHPMRVDYTDA